MAFKDGLLYFAKGMHAIKNKKLDDAIKYGNGLDAMLWRNEKQNGKDSTMVKWYQSMLNTASLELQGRVKSEEGNYEQVIKLLEMAEKNEKELGYSEPPFYAHPVAMSKAIVHEKAGKFDKAIESYNGLLQRCPKSAYVYYGLVDLYKKKGDSKKALEYEELLKVANKYGDKGIYPITNTN